MYDLDFLMKTFATHAVEAEITQRKLMEEFVKNNHGVPLPKHLKDDFNLPSALFSLCNEIQKLKKKR